MKPLLQILLLVLALCMPGVARDGSQRHAFRTANPCPITGKTTGACPGYVVNHKKPLCAGGADKPRNMEWQELQLSYKMDGIERSYCRCLKRRGGGECGTWRNWRKLHDNIEGPI